MATPTLLKPLIAGRTSRSMLVFCPTLVRTTRQKKPQLKQCKESRKSQLVRSLHNLRSITCAQQQKSSTQATPENGNAADKTTTSTTAASDLGPDCDPVNVPTSTLLAETVEDDDSSLDSPTVPNLRVHHPSSDPEFDDTISASQPLVHASPSTSQAFAPSLQQHTFKCINAYAGPLRRGHKRCLGSAFNLKVLWSNGVSTWESLDTFFQNAPQDVANCAQQHNLLGNPCWKHVQDHALNLPRSTTIADIDNKTELIDGTTLDPNSTIIEPMDQTVVAAKAANATNCF